MSQFTARVFALLLPALLMSAQAFGTTLAYKSFDDLVKESDAVISGRVASIESRYNASHEIYTFVTFDGLSVLGGDYQGQTLTLRFKGGQVENNISQIVGSPEFSVNDQVIVFVEGNGRYMVPVVGWTQGVFRVTADASGRRVILDHEGNRVLGISGGEVLKERTVQPAANILRPNSRAFTGIASENRGGGGTADDNSQQAGPDLNASALSSKPTLTSQAFESAIKDAASAKTFQHRLTSLSVGDFSLPANAGVDAGAGAPAAVGSQMPSVPQRKPAPPPQQQ